MEEASQLPLNINQELGMKKLTKKEYNKLIKAKVLSTGLYNGCHVEQAEVDDELYEHLQEIKRDYKKGVLTAFNADAELAFNYLRYEDEYSYKTKNQIEKEKDKYKERKCVYKV